jgi:hypothetical protein
MLGLIIALAAQNASATPQTPTEIANATRFKLAFAGKRVSDCTVTATSGNAQVDMYICGAARACGNQYSDPDKQATCVADKRKELADKLTAALNRKK